MRIFGLEIKKAVKQQSLEEVLIKQKQEQLHVVVGEARKIIDLLKMARECPNTDCKYNNGTCQKEEQRVMVVPAEQEDSIKKYYSQIVSLGETIAQLEESIHKANREMWQWFLQVKQSKSLYLLLILNYFKSLYLLLILKQSKSLYKNLKIYIMQI